MSALEELAALFSSKGARGYLGEPVTQAHHMFLAGALAERAGARDSLVAAALLHDVGHFGGGLSGEDLMAGVDNRHEQSGARLLAKWFGASVTEPVRLHVPAKRYLCHVEPEYFAALSAASKFTLKVQGGPMDPVEVAAFEREPYWADAVSVRRWDDQAKDPAVSAPGFEHFAPLLERLVRTPR